MHHSWHGNFNFCANIKLLLSVLLILCDVISLSITCEPSKKEMEVSVEISITQILKIFLGGIAMIFENLVGYSGCLEVCTAGWEIINIGKN